MHNFLKGKGLIPLTASRGKQDTLGAQWVRMTPMASICAANATAKVAACSNIFTVSLPNAGICPEQRYCALHNSYRSNNGWSQPQNASTTIA